MQGIFGDASPFILRFFALSPRVTAGGSVVAQGICHFLPMSVKPGNGTWPLTGF